MEISTDAEEEYGQIQSHLSKLGIHIWSIKYFVDEYLHLQTDARRKTADMRYLCSLQEILNQVSWYFNF